MPRGQRRGGIGFQLDHASLPGRKCRWNYAGRSGASQGKADFPTVFRPGETERRPTARIEPPGELRGSLIESILKTTNQHERQAAAQQFAIDAARLAANTRCHSVVVLDVSGLSPVTDYFVIATGTSARQMRSVADEIGELGDKQNFSPQTRSGYEGEHWILLDCIDVIVHVFSPDARQYYDLDGLWGDARQVEWNNQPPPSSAAPPAKT